MTTKGRGGGGGSTFVGTPEPYFSIERFDDERVASGHILREAEYALFSCYAEQGFGVWDMDVEIATLQRDTGMNKWAVTRGILGYSRLQDLPMLKELQEESKLLDTTRLAAIDTVCSELGNGVDVEVWFEIDGFLVDLFTPNAPNQIFPGTGTIYYQLRRRIGEIDPGVRYDEKRRKKREKQAEGKATLSYIRRAGGKTLEYSSDAATMSAVQAFIEETARENDISLADATTALLTGALVPPVQVTLYGYVPTTAPENGGNPIEGAPVFFPDSGWTDPHGLASLDEMGGLDGARIIPLDPVAEQETTSYRPTTAMIALCAGRDGTCLWPGCSKPAQRCQLDHRIPFDEGGRTTPSNLFSLCQHHHNVKTDRRAHYIVDPETREVVWLFDDGTYALTHLEGFIGDQLTPRNPRWRRSLDDIKVSRRHAAQFFAKAHTIADQIDDAYDAGEDPAELFAQLRDLEEEYGIAFDIQLVRPPF